MKKIIVLVVMALCVLASSAYADGLQTSGGVKPKRDSLQIPEQVYVRIKSIQVENNLNNVGYYKAWVDSQKSIVNEVKAPENKLSPELVEALKKSMESNDWVPFTVDQ